MTLPQTTIQPSSVGDPGHPVGEAEVDPPGWAAEAVHPALPGQRQEDPPPRDRGWQHLQTKPLDIRNRRGHRLPRHCRPERPK